MEKESSEHTCSMSLRISCSITSQTILSLPGIWVIHVRDKVMQLESDMGIVPTTWVQCMNGGRASLNKKMPGHDLIMLAKKTMVDG